MANNSLVEIPPFEEVEKKLCRPIDFAQRPIGLINVVGTHGADIDSVVRLTKNGEFSRVESCGLGSMFYLTPNLAYKNWGKTKFDGEVREITQELGVTNPVETSVSYAESRMVTGFEDVGDGDVHGGFVLTFNKGVLPLVQDIYIAEAMEGPESEMQLSEAPPLSSIQKIHPTSQIALDSLRKTLENLRQAV